MDLFRETAAGTIINYLSGGRVAAYPEQRPGYRAPAHFYPNNSSFSGTGTSPCSSSTFPLSSGFSDATHATRVGAESASVHPGAAEVHEKKRRESNHLDQPEQPKRQPQERPAENAEKGFDPNLVDWYGPDDPENPRNWSTAKKTFVTSQLCLLTFAIYVGSSIYSAGIQDVVAQFRVSQVAATLGLTMFVLGYGVGPMFLSPLSEIPAFGRNAIYILTLVIFVIIQVPTALCQNLGALLPLRFLAGFIGSPVLATGGASLSDLFIPSKRAYPVGIWGIAAVCGPVLGPLVGGFAAQAESWRWTIWIILWLSGGALAILMFSLPETSAQNILVKRARRLRKLTGNLNLRTAGEIEQANMKLSDVITTTMVRPFVLGLREPIIFFLNLYCALVYGLLYLWFESYPIVFIELYGFNLGQEGLTFLGQFVGAIIAYALFCLYSYVSLEKQFEDGGMYIVPEKRLPPACVGAFAIPICCFWFGWTSQASIHWMVPIVGSAFFSIGAFTLFTSVINYLGDSYPRYGASVLASNDLFRAGFGAAFPLFADAMFRNLGGGGGVAWGSSLVGFLSVAMIPIPFVLYYYGPRIRQWSKYAD